MVGTHHFRRRLADLPDQSPPLDFLGASLLMTTKPLPPPALPVALAARDLNGDRRVDLAAVCLQAGAVVILAGKGDGTFRPAGTHATGGNPSAIAAGDWNGDGAPDLAVANDRTMDISLLFGTPR
mgnify:CR=1 FL=1